MNSDIGPILSHAVFRQPYSREISDFGSSHWKPYQSV